MRIPRLWLVSNLWMRFLCFCSFRKSEKRSEERQVELARKAQTTIVGRYEHGRKGTRHFQKKRNILDCSSGSLKIHYAGYYADNPGEQGGEINPAQCFVSPCFCKTCKSYTYKKQPSEPCKTGIQDKN